MTQHPITDPAALQATAMESHAGAVLAAAEAISRDLGWRPAAGDLHGG